MDDRQRLHEALRHVDQASLALAHDVTEHELEVARAQLVEVRALLSDLALSGAGSSPARTARTGRSAPTPRAGEDEDVPALVERVHLHGDLRAAAVARSFSSTTCRSWGVPAAGTSTVVDLASELVSNAARHVGGPVDLALERRGRFVLVTVGDQSAELPRLLPYRRGVSEQGIGLRLVDQLSESWGWTSVPEGKRVWARAAVSDAPAPVRPVRQAASSRRSSAGAT